MCGIFGFFSQTDTLIDQEKFLLMGSVIRHRGPDGEGIYYDADKRVGLGNERLAILDIEAGDQPFISDDGSVVVVQNGEIFNHVELAEELSVAGYPCATHCDTEVILRLYEQGGIVALEKLNGMFAIAIFDKREDAVYLMRDRVGEKPYYWYEHEGAVLFASEIKSILQVTGEIPFSPEALNAFLTYNFVPPPMTMFEGVKHVEPGCWLRIGRDGISTHRWWDLASVYQQDASEEEWIKGFNSVLDDAVRIRLRSDVPFGAFLSGGVDSSTVVGLMSQHLSQPVRTFSIGFDDPRYDESPFAQSAAERFGCDHNCEIVDPDMISGWAEAIYYCDQPHGDVSFLPTRRVADMAARQVKMVLTGDGADELFAGYDKYKNFFATDMTAVSAGEFQEKYADNISLFNDEKREDLLSRDIKARVDVNSVHQEVLTPLFAASAHMDRINQALYIDMKLLLSGNNLVKPDRMGMAASIENRAPFMDYRVMELAFKMPGDLKLRDGETKYIYKKAVEELIGSDLTYRKKQMFTVPVGEWFKSRLKPMCEDLLLSEQTRARGLFDYGYVAELLESHCQGVKNNTREIRALMAVELWFRAFYA
ncbi:asparagine synthase (glutamine-hydrolyzing) [Marinobacterium jannaschii]|uniref:asparagine synthase (glutamine-hydrolyzing) n=1 Tax=Marinobacterium jannaschii TaxID=64970 RepID=UPI00048A4118|nr:asparagine synthase (glutamine-hydrolyzing) [Marinobacterium jannaschii]